VYFLFIFSYNPKNSFNSLFSSVFLIFKCLHAIITNPEVWNLDFIQFHQDTKQQEKKAQQQWRYRLVRPAKAMY
jgi:hypothetical protein